MNANTAVWAGFVSTDFELRQISPSGRALGTFSIAYNRPPPKGQPDAKGGVDFLEVKVWGKPAQACAERVKKGMGIICYGTIKMDSWKGQDGKTHTRHTLEAWIVAETIMHQKPTGSDNDGQ